MFPLKKDCDDWRQHATNIVQTEERKSPATSTIEVDGYSAFAL